MSRNQREGKYSGWYAAPYKAKHWRTGNSEYRTMLMSLKEVSKFNKLIGAI